MCNPGDTLNNDDFRSGRLHCTRKNCLRSRNNGMGVEPAK
jgi:hypothetical protein